MAGELILIVDDHARTRKLIRDLLQLKGYQTLDAESAEEALPIVRAAHPALVIMDIRLPGMDGVTAFRQLRADPETKAIRVIAVTASSTNHNRRSLLAAGFDGYHPKPIHVNEFLDTVRRTLDRH